jgi:uncharacterized damage-inducible protein DinB
MKFSKVVLFFLLTIFMSFSVMAQSYFKKEYPGVWQRATTYTLEVAEAVPADKYDYRLMEGSMTFHEQMAHVIQNLSFLSGVVTGNRPDFFKGKEPEELSKGELCVLLKEAFMHVSHLIEEVDEQTLQERIEFGGEKMPIENIFYLMRDHASHHRGQAILYLRMNGVEAPWYRGW